VTDDGIVIDVKEKQRLNAFLPIDVTEDGMLTESKEVQLPKA